MTARKMKLELFDASTWAKGSSYGSAHKMDTGWLCIFEYKQAMDDVGRSEHADMHERLQCAVFQ